MAQPPQRQRPRPEHTALPPWRHCAHTLPDNRHIRAKNTYLRAKQFFLALTQCAKSCRTTLGYLTLSWIRAPALEVRKRISRTRAKMSLCSIALWPPQFLRPLLNFFDYFIYFKRFLIKPSTVQLKLDIYHHPNDCPVIFVGPVTHRHKIAFYSRTQMVFSHCVSERERNRSVCGI